MAGGRLGALIMKPLAAAAVAVCLGCPDYNMREFVLTDDEIRNGFVFDGRTLEGAGTWRYEIWAFNTRVGTHRYLFSGPGGIFWLIPYQGGLEPLDLSKTYESWGSRHDNTIVYLPPPPSDDLPVGARATFACEVLSPVSGRWIRSQDWLLPVVRTEGPVGFRLACPEPGGQGGERNGEQ
jgi:hypothetical protein